MAKVLDREIVVREFELQSRYHVHFRTNTLEKRYEPLILQLLVELYHYCSSIRTALSINWLTKVDMPLNKETEVYLEVSGIWIWFSLNDQRVDLWIGLQGYSHIESNVRKASVLFVVSGPVKRVTCTTFFLTAFVQEVNLTECNDVSVFSLTSSFAV